MYARAVEEAAITLRDLRRAEWEDLALGLVALGSAIAATTILPSLALPLFLGGVAIGARGLRALWLRWDLVERLAGERDAYVISEVRDRALRETTMGRRRAFAAVIRTYLCDPENARLRFLEAELEDLAAELEDPDLTLQPSSGVACFHLLGDPLARRLLDPAVSDEELRARIAEVRSGLTRRPDAVAGTSD
jgi:hypothetical protein